MHKSRSPDNMDFPLCTTSWGRESSPPINEIKHQRWSFDSHTIYQGTIDLAFDVSIPSSQKQFPGIIDTAPTKLKYQKSIVTSKSSSQPIRTVLKNDAHISTANHIKVTLKALCPIHSTATKKHVCLTFLPPPSWWRWRHCIDTPWQYSSSTSPSQSTPESTPSVLLLAHFSLCTTIKLPSRISTTTGSAFWRTSLNTP